MRLGYGYRRSSRDLLDIGADRTWIDDETTDRRERDSLLRDALSAGDAVILVDSADLGEDEEIAGLTGEIEARGASIEIARPGRPRKTGAKPKFAPSGNQDIEAKRLWHDTRYGGAYALSLIRNITGFDGSERSLRNALNHRYGSRRSPKKDRP